MPHFKWSYCKGKKLTKDMGKNEVKSNEPYHWVGHDSIIHSSTRQGKASGTHGIQKRHSCDFIAHRELYKLSLSTSGDGFNCPVTMSKTGDKVFPDFTGPSL